MSKKIVVIETEDKERHLRIGMNALVELEGLLGKPITAISGDEMALQDLRAMYYVGLKWEDKKLTLAKTGEIMDEIVDNHGMQYLSEKIGEAIKGAVGNAGLPS